MLTECFLGKLAYSMKLIQLHRRQLCGFVIWWSLPLIQVADILRQKSRLFPITLWRKSVSQASSNGFGSLNLLVNIFGDGFVAKKLLLKTRWERQQRAYSDNPYDIKKIQTSAENRKTKPPHRLQHYRRSKIAAQFDFSHHCWQD